MNIIKQLEDDIRYEEGLNSCMNCGICTAICPAAEFQNYDPRVIISTVQSQNEEEIQRLLAGETIWYCGQCMSCKTRCPRNNCPGMVIQALRKISQKSGLFMQSERGRQQIKLKRVIGQSIINKGYCMHPTLVIPSEHPEQGPIWEWVFNNMNDVYERLGANLDQYGPGILRKIDKTSISELHSILDQTGCTEFFNLLEQHNDSTNEKSFSNQYIDNEDKR